MAVPKKKKSLFKRKIKYKKILKNLNLNIDKENNIIHIRHHNNKKNYYRGFKINGV